MTAGVPTAVLAASSFFLPVILLGVKLRRGFCELFAFPVFEAPPESLDVIGLAAGGVGVGLDFLAGTVDAGGVRVVPRFCGEGCGSCCFCCGEGFGLESLGGLGGGVDADFGVPTVTDAVGVRFGGDLTIAAGCGLGGVFTSAAVPGAKSRNSFITRIISMNEGLDLV